ncbi:MAG: hypothetical protein ACR2K6_12005 [Solirubrobacterales bacterium]
MSGTSGRRRWARAGGAVAALGAGMALAIAPAGAQAACAGPAEGQEREFYRDSLERADGAITGKVVRKQWVEAGDPDDAGQPPPSVVVTYRVGRAYKKKDRLVAGTRLKILGGNSSEAFNPRVGSRGGVLLYRSKGEWTASACSTISKRDLRRADRDLRRGR